MISRDQNAADGFVEAVGVGNFVTVFIEVFFGGTGGAEGVALVGEDDGAPGRDAPRFWIGESLEVT